MTAPNPPHKTVAARHAERRTVDADRRKRSASSLIYGNVTPRRRSPRRREDRNSYIADWHDSALLLTVVTILLLSATDAFLTMHLLDRGAREVNWFMAQLIHADTREFVAFKMALTGLGVIVLVTRRHVLLFGRIQVGKLLYVTLLGYLVLIVYEGSMFVRLHSV